jgi:hypothetical protein
MDDNIRSQDDSRCFDDKTEIDAVPAGTFVLYQSFFGADRKNAAENRRAIASNQLINRHQ